MAKSLRGELAALKVEVAANTALQAEVAANSAKTGISADQAAAIVANSAYLSLLIPEFDMVYVSAGDFLYGPASGDHTWTSTKNLPGFFIDKYEVTAAEYKACVDARACEYNGGAGVDQTYDSGKGDHPINYVNWDEANAYCAWKGKRLPSEQEWEKAARGTDGRTYPWGEAAPDCTYAVIDQGGDGCARNSTMRVGSKAKGASPYGALDMAGSLNEWTDSWYDVSEEDRVLRGGLFYDYPYYLESSSRNYRDPGNRTYNIGFRCAQ